MKKQTVRDVLDIVNFDPMNIDVSEFEELAKAMPRDANIDLQIAETLAARYLRAADRCSEILSKLTLLESKSKTNKSAIRNRLYLVAKDEGYKTVEERKAYSESHESYIQAEDKFSEVYAAKKIFEMRYDFFLKSHQYMKEKLRAEVNHRNLSGFSETAGSVPDNENKYGEKDW